MQAKTTYMTILQALHSQATSRDQGFSLSSSETVSSFWVFIELGFKFNIWHKNKNKFLKNTSDNHFFISKFHFLLFSSDFLKNIWWNQKLYLHLLPKNHNSITKQINWSKNEENDNGCKQLPSGSLAKLKNLVCESAMVFCALSLVRPWGFASKILTLGKAESKLSLFSRLCDLWHFATIVRMMW